MILYPAIDLKDGQAVRLLKGEMDKATVFNDDPASQAAQFVEAGCEWLHLVDLNGAFAGEPVNAAAVEAILERVSVPTQLGGGIRDAAAVEGWFELGVARGEVAKERLGLSHQRRVIDGAGRREDHLVGAVMLGDKTREVFAGECLNPLGRAEDGAAQRLIGIRGLLQPVEDHVVRRVVGLADLLQDHPALDLDFDGDNNVAGEDVNDQYSMLPVVIEVRWRETQGADRVYQLKTVIPQRPTLDPNR